jgi:hypothetical protein
MAKIDCLLRSPSSEHDRAGVKMDTAVLDDRSSDAEIQSAVRRAGAADVVIVSMYGRVRSGQVNSVALPKPGATALNLLLERRAPLVGVSFGNPYLLMGFPPCKLTWWLMETCPVCRKRSPMRSPEKSM